MSDSETVAICDYSPLWPAMFEAEAQALREALGPSVVRVEHIGSTAVPGMGAKPIIDILVGAESLPAIERGIPGLVALGYRYIPEFEDQLPQRRYLVRPSPGPARFHVHAVEIGGPFWTEHLAFRDALRSDRELFNEYLALKRRLAEAHHADSAGYTDAKAPFIQRAIHENARRA
jgi:GrpB-like predicted nucleotidyltransferase (UPF0157 family)